MFMKLVLAETRPGRADIYEYSHCGDPAIMRKARNYGTPHNSGEPRYYGKARKL